MKNIEAKGSYGIPKDMPNAGQVVDFDFSYEVHETLDEAVAQLGGEGKVLAMLNQTHKEDCRNNASGSAKSANGHSSTKALTPEEKESRNQGRKADRELLAILKSKGLTADDIASL